MINALSLYLHLELKYTKYERQENGEVFVMEQICNHGTWYVLHMPGHEN